LTGLVEPMLGFFTILTCHVDRLRILESGDGNGSNLVCGTHPDHQPLAAPEKAARKLLEIANATEAVQDGRIYIEAINAQFQFKEGGTPEEYRAGLACAVTKGWLWKHES
jgi:hypothetical protein